MGAKGLEYGQGGPEPPAGEKPQDLFDCSFTAICSFIWAVEGNDELVLEKAAAPVQSIPVGEGVEGVEEGVVMDNGIRLPPPLPSVVERVEGATREAVHQKGWHAIRHAGAGRRVQSQRIGRVALFGGGVAAQHHQAPSSPGGAREGIYPGYGVGVFGLCSQQRAAGGFQIACLLGPHLQESRLHPSKSHGCGVDESRQAHAAHSSLEELRVLLRGASDLGSSCQHHMYLPDEAADGSVHVVVLAVHVGADTATQGDELGAWSDRKEPASRKGKTDDLLKGDTRFSAEDTLRGVEGQESVQGQGGDEAAGEAGVAVAETAALRQQGRPLAGKAHEILEASSPTPDGGHDRKPPPTCDILPLHAPRV